jgi:hypothetical protein
MRHLVAHCHLGLGRLRSRTGQIELAPEHLATAAAMFRAMGMKYWLEKSEAAMPYGLGGIERLGYPPIRPAWPLYSVDALR